jgi:hypothetical protein
MHPYIYVYVVFSFYYYFLTGGNKKWMQTSCMDANLIQIAPESHDMGGQAYQYHGALGREAYLPI